MSSRIWTRCAGSSRVRALSARPVRLVEAQHLVATRRLVDSVEEQELLEHLLERSKPALPVEPDFDGLHYLLTTSFRYPPLRHGSRFGTRHERSLWYGAKDLRTASAEVAYYRLLFLDGTHADLGRVDVELTAFRSRVRTARGIDLTRAPFADHAGRISSKSRYEESQALGETMREAGVEAFRYRSARDPRGGECLALYTPRAFAAKRPDGFQAWTCSADRARVEFRRKDYFDRSAWTFDREEFLVDGTLPAPAP